MPGRDGTGPRGVGPFTGRGAGNCAIVFPKSGRPYGYAGLQGALIGGFCRPAGRLPGCGALRDRALRLAPGVGKGARPQ